MQLPFVKGTPCFGLECGKGWHPLIMRTHKKLIAIDPDYVVMQVKEKFGGLRYYIATGTDEMFDIIDAAEEESYHICEECGEPGKLRGDGWLSTLCNKHYVK